MTDITLPVLPSVEMTKRLEFDAGHRLLNHESRCFNVHGHRFAVEVTCKLAAKREGLDKAGRIIDFGKVKEVFGTWLDEKLDHTYIANEEDSLLEVLKKTNKKPIYVVPFEPSSENLAMHLFGIAYDLLEQFGVVVTALVLYETPTSKATATARHPKDQK